MAGKPKLSARDAFDDNLSDAETLVRIAKALQNKRKYRMRREMRERLGEALGIARKHWDDLDCIESDDLFAVFQPTSALDRNLLDEASLRPLLRQAVVAACAAVETFVADRTMERIRAALDSEERPARLLALPMTVGDWLRIEENYERRRWGLRGVIELEVRRLASPAPSQIGMVFGFIGVKDVWRAVDRHRRCDRGLSVAQLDAFYRRRNRIAHQGDRSGRGRAGISVDDIERDLAVVVEIVDGLDAVTR